jgi:hypothetical protein
MPQDLRSYHQQLYPADQVICELLARTIENELTEATHKIWHAHPVWFLDDNPTAGYSKQKWE